MLIEELFRPVRLFVLENLSPSTFIRDLRVVFDGYFAKNSFIKS